MSDSYRLEILPTQEGKEFYTRNIHYQSNDNAGFDLFVAKDTMIPRGTVALLDLGCRARLVRCHPDEMEEDVHFWLAPRSSIWKSDVMMANSMGIIDRTYRGLLMGAVTPIHTSESEMRVVNGTLVRVYADCDSLDRVQVSIAKGQRLFQMVAPDMGWIKEVRIVDSLPETSRGEGGFGSTGR